MMLYVNIDANICFFANPYFSPGDARGATTWLWRDRWNNSRSSGRDAFAPRGHGEAVKLSDVLREGPGFQSKKGREAPVCRIWIYGLTMV